MWQWWEELTRCGRCEKSQISGGCIKEAESSQQEWEVCLVMSKTRGVQSETFLTLIAGTVWIQLRLFSLHQKNCLSLLFYSFPFILRSLHIVGLSTEFHLSSSHSSSSSFHLDLFIVKLFPPWPVSYIRPVFHQTCFSTRSQLLFVLHWGHKSSTNLQDRRILSFPTCHWKKCFWTQQKQANLKHYTKPFSQSMDTQPGLCR